MLFGCETFEIQILDVIHSLFGCDFMDAVMLFFSAINNAGILWIAVAITLLCIKKYRKTGIIMAIGLILGVIFGNLILKNFIARPRPCWLEENLQMLIAIPKDYSFPSGHTLSSFIASFVLFDRDKRLGIPALCVATIIAFSRMYLFAHFPTDILGGIVLAALIYAIMKSVLKKLKML